MGALEFGETNYEFIPALTADGVRRTPAKTMLSANYRNNRWTARDPASIWRFNVRISCAIWGDN
jgi:hypothetical protein